MRLIKQQTTNARSITGKGYKYNLATNIASVDANALLVPKGATDTKPLTSVNGYVRYNTDIEAFEFFVDNTWKVVRYKEPGQITQQTLGPGNGTYTVFGPLESGDDDFPEPANAQSILVFVENVYQVPITNYVLQRDPAGITTGAVIDAFYLVNGVEYVIVDSADTDFTKVGAAVNVSGETFIADLTVETQFILPKLGPTLGGRFGYSVDMQNNGVNSLMITGAYKNSDTATEAGKVYVYNLAGALAYEIPNPQAFGTQTEDWFGFSVAINQTHIAVGAFQEDSSALAGVGDNNGKVFLYELDTINVNTPTTQLEIPAGIGDATDWFGYDIAMSETHLVVGAPKEEPVNLKPSGRAYIYDLADTTTPVIIDNPLDYDSGGLWFGSAVDISSNYVIVGTNNIEGQTYQNKAYIFNLAGDHLYTLNNPNTAETDDDGFGRSVAISDRFAIVGAFNESFDGVSGTGRVYFYELPQVDPLQPTDLAPKLYPDPNSEQSGNTYLNDDFGGLKNPNIYGTPLNDFFGYSVSISDVYALVSGHTEDIPNYEDPNTLEQDAGVVYVFDLLTGELLVSINDEDWDVAPGGDLFGSALAITNTHIIVGAYDEGAEEGAVYVYEIEGKALGSGTVRRAGLYLEFSSAVDTGKPITVIHNLDK